MDGYARVDSLYLEILTGLFGVLGLWWLTPTTIGIDPPLPLESTPLDASATLNLYAPTIGIDPMPLRYTC